MSLFARLSSTKASALDLVFLFGSDIHFFALGRITTSSSSTIKVLNTFTPISCRKSCRYWATSTPISCSRLSTTRTTCSSSISMLVSPKSFFTPPTTSLIQLCKFIIRRHKNKTHTTMIQISLIRTTFVLWKK